MSTLTIFLRHGSISCTVDNQEIMSKLKHYMQLGLDVIGYDIKRIEY